MAGGGGSLKGVRSLTTPMCIVPASTHCRATPAPICFRDIPDSACLFVSLCKIIIYLY
jgi:hypothetical protein